MMHLKEETEVLPMENNSDLKTVFMAFPLSRA